MYHFSRCKKKILARHFGGGDIYFFFYSFPQENNEVSSMPETQEKCQIPNGYCLKMGSRHPVVEDDRCFLLPFC